MATMEGGWNRYNGSLLSLLTLSYVFGEFAHYLIGVLTKDMSQDIGYGDYSCYANETSTEVADANNITIQDCNDFSKSEVSCKDATFTIDNSTNKNETYNYCEYLHNGQGTDYLVLAGTIFLFIFCVMGVIMGYLSDKISRPKLMATCTMLFSVCGMLTGLAKEYWHLVILRMGVAAGEAALRPAAGSMIPEIFGSSIRGTANGIFSWGIYWGYGLTFTLGNYLAPLDLFGNNGWRSTFIIGCAPGVIVAIFLFFYSDPRWTKKKALNEANKSVKTYGTSNEEERDGKPKDMVDSENTTKDNTAGRLKEEKQYWKTTFYAMIQPVMLLLLFAALIRQAGGLTWAFNTQLYIEEYYPDFNPGIWVAVDSIVGGSFGVFAGGYLSDYLVRKLGLHTRLWVLALSQVLAAPLAAGVLSVEPPYCFVFLLVYYFFAETWFAVLFTVMVEVVPTDVRSIVIAIFLFLMNNIGGQIPLIITPMKDALGFRYSLMIVWPGCILLSGILFFVSSFPLWKNYRKQQRIGI